MKRLAEMTLEVKSSTKRSNQHQNFWRCLIGSTTCFWINLMTSIWSSTISWITVQRSAIFYLARWVVYQYHIFTRISTINPHRRLTAVWTRLINWWKNLTSLTLKRRRSTQPAKIWFKSRACWMKSVRIFASGWSISRKPSIFHSASRTPRSRRRANSLQKSWTASMSASIIWKIMFVDFS